VGVDIIAVPDEPPPQQTKRTRRAEPITKRTAKNGLITYEFRADVGNKPDGTRDRRRFTYRTLSEARREYRRITSEVATGTYTRKSAITVAEACDEWLAGRRGIRRVTLQGYTHDLKPVRRYLGGKKLQQLTKADGDELVEWMLTEGRSSPKRYRPDSLAARVVTLRASPRLRSQPPSLRTMFTPACRVYSELVASLDSAEPSTHSTTSPRPKSPHVASSQLQCVPH
jgi:hypothetical protein